MAVCDVYRNLNKGGLSAKAVSGENRGRVVERAGTALVEGATFRVQRAGLMRARREGQRNVHAFVRGEASMGADVRHVFEHPDAVPVRYNPFLADHFVRADNGEPVTEARVVGISEGRMAALF